MYTIVCINNNKRVSIYACHALGLYLIVISSSPDRAPKTDELFFSLVILSALLASVTVLCLVLCDGPSSVELIVLTYCPPPQHTATQFLYHSIPYLLSISILYRLRLRVGR